ncbi:MAG: HAMP domain-containing histidine kinase [Cyanobacteria bacterium]|nr:HAMP domain-containing histidine kinase [Cyanobacteriota bacterium]
MTVGRRGVSAVTILVGVVMLLVPSLAWMQYQWLGQLSTAERERMQRTLKTAAAQFATEFDSELSRTLVSLQVDGPTIRNQNWIAYAGRYSAWVNSVTEPRLVRDVWLVDTKPGTVLPPLDGESPVPIDQLRLRKWNTQALTFEDAEWPEDLVKLRATLSTRFLGIQMQRAGQRGAGRIQNDAPGTHREATLSVTLGDDNTLISPVTLFEMRDDRNGPPKISILGFTIVRLDPVVIRETILAALTQRHFHGGDSEVDYRVVVVKKDDPKTVIWESEPGIAASVTASPDVEQGFMGPRPDQMFVFARNLRDDIPPPPPPSPGRREPGTGNRVDNIVVSMIEKETGQARGGGRLITRGGFDTRWVLMAKHRSGSLEAAVAAVRTRNLMVSSGILMLLTVVIGLIAVSARRSQELARQQMEFVAAVSHELRTPVSVIGAAAGNLADGVVGDPQRVRKYGETIQGEARRLGETVERVLQLAGIAAGRAAAAQAPIDPATLVSESIAACRTEIDAAGFNVEVAVADNLPTVVGDVAALRSALQNLIVNGVKYGGTARWLRVSARREPGAGNREQVIFSVADRGMGIDADDRKHIFEPFYRGKDAVSQQIQGSGLGLNLVMRIVEAHGGTVSVTSEPGKGSTFTLALPAAHDRPATALDTLVAEASK